MDFTFFRCKRNAVTNLRTPSSGETAARSVTRSRPSPSAADIFATMVSKCTRWVLASAAERSASAVADFCTSTASVRSSTTLITRTMCSSSLSPSASSSSFRTFCSSSAFFCSRSSTSSFHCRCCCVSDWITSWRDSHVVMRSRNVRPSCFSSVLRAWGKLKMLGTTLEDVPPSGAPAKDSSSRTRLCSSAVAAPATATLFG
mmetsp:Transcript_14789/g.36864  ORF Transcript_14789/g.36864 Transcript_14789/m.36864 type:complete len:202 (+) Transcript_14789:2283-2888(+)